MENLILKYGKVLDKIGDVIVNESKKLEIPANVQWTEKDVVQYYAKLENAEKQFDKCLGELKSTVPPVQIAKEHLNLIASYNVFVDAAKSLLKSISIVPVRYDIAQINEGIARMKQGELLVVQACNSIVSKAKQSMPM